VNNDLSTIDTQIGFSEMDVSASGAWNESYIKRPKTIWHKISQLGHVAGMVLAIAATPATAIQDYWFLERRRRDVSTVAWVLESVIGRPISRVEALQIARQILVCAEQERIQLAEWEAERGIQWEEGE